MENILTDQDFANFRDLIYNASGIHFSDSNRVILESRLKERLRNNKMASPSEYLSVLKRDEGELKVLLDSVTTNLTRFFRNTAHFDTIENYVFPNLVKKARAEGRNKIKIWSAGCSTGEEPYSIAMMAKEKLPPGMTVEITASDLSLKSLMTAKEGYYPTNRCNGIPDLYLSKYFDKKNDGYQVKKEIQDAIKFDYHNLKFDSGRTGLDIVFCRNVIIYFDEAAQEAVIQKFWKALSKKSFLFIGHSESLFGMKTEFEFLKTDWACIYQKS